jgi:hypothetical protein
MTNFKEPDPAGIPYLFLQITQEEIDQVTIMQEFMEKHQADFPAMTVRAMMHYTAVQLRNIMNIWKKDTMRQIAKHDVPQPITEEQEKHILNMQYAHFIAFLLASKKRLPDSYDILHSVTQILLKLYPPSDEEGEAK